MPSGTPPAVRGLHPDHPQDHKLVAQTAFHGISKTNDAKTIRIPLALTIHLGRVKGKRKRSLPVVPIRGGTELVEGG